MDINLTLNGLPAEVQNKLSEFGFKPDKAEEPKEEKKEEIVVDSEEKPAILEENESAPVEPKEKTDFEVYLDTVPEDKRELYKYAHDTGWDYQKANKPGGKSAEVYVALEPVLKNHKQIYDELQDVKKQYKELHKTIKSNKQLELDYTKKQAEKYADAAKSRLQQAKEDKDYEGMEAAYRDIESVQEIIQTADKQLATVAEPKPYEYTPAHITAAKEFNKRNIDWCLEGISPNYNKEKLVKAQELETEYLTKYPTLDPDLLYARIELEINKEFNSKQDTAKEEPKSPAVRNAAIESISTVRSAENNVNDHRLSRGEKLLATAMKELKNPVYDHYLKSKGMK